MAYVDYRKKNFYNKAFIGQFAKQFREKLGTDLTGTELTSRLNRLLPKVGLKPDHNGQYSITLIKQLLLNSYGKLDHLRELWSEDQMFNKLPYSPGRNQEPTTFIPRRKGESNVSNELLRNQEIYEISLGDIRHMVSECIRRVISERVTDILYHYTDLHGLNGILSSNTLKPVDSDSVSFTRQRNSNTGFALQYKGYDCIVRFKVDGSLINQKYKGGPYNWNAGSGVETYKPMLNTAHFSHPTDPDSEDFFDDPNFNEQSEDRVYCGKNGITDFSRYVIRTDILVNDERLLQTMKKAQERFPDFNIVLYSSEMDFNRL